MVLYLGFGVVVGLGIRAGKSLHNDALCKPEGRGKRNRTGEVPIMPALSEREPKVRLRRRFSKNKIGRGTLFYFCDSLFPSCRLAAPACRQAGMCPGRSSWRGKREKPSRLPRFPRRYRRGKSEPFHRFLLPYLKGVVVGFRMREGGSFA